MALVLAPIIAGFVAEITLHFATKTPAIEAAPPPPPPVVHQTIVNHYYGPGGQRIGVPQAPTTTTERPITVAGGIPRRDYLEAVHISQMIEKKMDETEDQEELQRMESNLDQLLTQPDKDTLLGGWSKCLERSYLSPTSRITPKKKRRWRDPCRL